ncbi:ROK family protein, partial [bacterium]|nr:ROK family protein [bacterium]
GGAGDFGHIIIDKDGPLCYCGKRGCLETFSSDQFIINKIKEALSNQQDTIIKDFLKKKEDLNSITVDTVLEAAQKGDIISKNIFQEVGKNLAMGIVGLISLFDPELIVVGGEGVRAGEFIFPTMRKAIKDNFPFKKEIEIVPLQPGEEGWIIGAAELVLSEVFKTPIFKSKGKVAIKSAFHW